MWPLKHRVLPRRWDQEKVMYIVDLADESDEPTRRSTACRHQDYESGRWMQENAPAWLAQVSRACDRGEI
jgi:hypothetical protein